MPTQVGVLGVSGGRSKAVGQGQVAYDRRPFLFGRFGWLRRVASLNFCMLRGISRPQLCIWVSPMGPLLFGVGCLHWPSSVALGTFGRLPRSRASAWELHVCLGVWRLSEELVACTGCPASTR